MKSITLTPATTAEHRARARTKLPRFLFDYIDGGANDELSLKGNVQAFADTYLRQKVMCDVSKVSTETTLSGQKASMPLMLAPVGMAGMFARRAEVMAAHCADKQNIPFTLSTLGVCSLDEIRQSGAKPVWFQLYMLRDRNAVESLLQSARDNGCDTLVFTVDLAMIGLRHRDSSNGMVGDQPLAMALKKMQHLLARPGWLVDVGLLGKPHTIGNLSQMVPDPTDLNTYKQWIDEQFDPSVTWADIAWLRSIWPGKLIIKGILNVDDALAARDVGADAIVVSNHGGRQLDSAVPTLSKLPDVVAALDPQFDVYLDGGVRSGIDIAKALCLGARGVMMGRPWVWAAAGSGEAGLQRLLNTYHQELKIAMALMGVNSVEELNQDLIEQSPFA